MIRVFVGSTTTSRDDYTRVFDESSFSVPALREELETPSLFGDTKKIALLYVLGIHGSDVLSFLESYTGAHDIVIREHALPVALDKRLRALGAVIEEGAVHASQPSSFNVWSLTDAILARDKKNAWLLYREAIENGSAPEELSGIVWWQVKSMLLALREEQPKDMKPFVLQKTRRGLQKYSADEVSSLARRLVTAVHEPRRGKGKSDEWLEALILSL